MVVASKLGIISMYTKDGQSRPEQVRNSKFAANAVNASRRLESGEQITLHPFPVSSLECEVRVHLLPRADQDGGPKSTPKAQPKKRL